MAPRPLPARRTASLLLAASALMACAPHDPARVVDPGAAPRRPHSDEKPDKKPEDPTQLSWAELTQSPRESASTGLARELSSQCARSDGSLDAVAERLNRRLLEGRPALDPAELTLELRASGAPYVWPRSWSYSGPELEAPDARGRAGKWLGGFVVAGKPTCGAAHMKQNGQEAVTLVWTDALADLERIPSSARVGQWLDVTARMRVPTHDAKVVVLGPHGAPRAIPTSLDQGTVQARFAPNSAGTWLVQVVASVDSGPRPVVEALVHADSEPPGAFHAKPAPGEGAAAAGSDDEDALVRMVNAARKAEGLGSLRRDASLDRAARAHAEAMRDRRTLGHDVGSGSVGERLAELGLSPRAFGENVARAATIERAHRAIWASPSHRSNLLEARYDAVGVATARGPGGLWVCEVFADSRE